MSPNRRALRLGVALAAAFSLAAQDVPAPALQIRILDGDEALNNIRQRTAREPIVQVEDENHKPVAGAVVLFSLPGNGAGGTFLNGSTTLSVTTDARGQAVARGLRPNNVPGRFQIHVTATSDNRTGRATINQTNELGGAAVTANSTARWFAVAIAAGAVAGVAAAVATHHNAPPALATPIQITPGTGTVGAPR